ASRQRRDRNADPPGRRAECTWCPASTFAERFGGPPCTLSRFDVARHRIVAAVQSILFRHLSDADHCREGADRHGLRFYGDCRERLREDQADCARPVGIAGVLRTAANAVSQPSALACTGPLTDGRVVAVPAIITLRRQAN